ncbi:MarP family serine protease [Spiractinospora alimapuensis]|uniref:MarP family serine protease n=1 Tax=Spiractinospora alimapuensis TaxID=2820884 RepID=UPI001F256816|nr:MarP family serine protease [Spiractinospora alimapuensis]QVQ50366.1 MarP family serine protease [Spiractinospora alimapuensis]
MLDVILVAVALLFALAGYRQGFIVGVLSFAGLLGGGIAAAIGLPPLIMELVSDPGQQALLAVAAVFLSAAVGQFSASYLGALLRNRVTGDSVRVLDALGGVVVNASAVLLIAWLIGSALANSSIPVVSNQIENSRVLHAVDRAIPDGVNTWFSEFRQAVDQSEFPQVFSGIGPGTPIEVEPPDPDVLNTEELRDAGQSVVKVLGAAPDCERRVEGTGFAYAPDRIMTNAHVVAGVREDLRVVTRSGEQLPATVVLYDPQQDLAVLEVEGLGLEPLEFDTEGEAGDDAVVAGFPRNSGFTVMPARIRVRQSAQGPDFYQEQQVSREIFQVRANVQPGNSGGPLLAPDGTVYGVVFAAATQETETGYVLTAEEVAENAEEGVAATEPVSTQGCD